MIVQIQKLWILYYICVLVVAQFLFYHYTATDLVHSDQKVRCCGSSWFFSSTTVILNHFAEGSQNQTYNFGEPH